jgi:hypothetical protein
VLSGVTHPEAAAASPSPLLKWWVAVAVIFGAITMDFGGNVLNVAIPKMMTSFGVSLDKIQWVLTGYVVARAAQIGAFQDTLLLLALLQVLALIPTLLIRSARRRNALQAAKSEAD